jgi:hypothetical protein
MTTETHRENACPGALMRKRQTWPPPIAHETRTPRFSAPQPWTPRRWRRPFVHVDYAHFFVQDS